MATEALKSTAITNIDASPPVRATAGAGGMGILQSIHGVVAPTTAMTLGSTYRAVRVPSNCYLKHVLVDASGNSTSTFTGDITLYYSDEALDESGASAGNTGLVNSLSGTSSLFAHAEAMGGYTNGVVTDVTNHNDKAYPPSAKEQPLWQAAGLASDPGGFFDVTIVTTATNTIAAGNTFGVEVQFVLPYV